MCGCTSSDCADAGLGQHVLRGFNAAIGRAEAKRTRSEMQSWHMARHTNQTLVQLTEWANPRIPRLDQLPRGDLGLRAALNCPTPERPSGPTGEAQVQTGWADVAGSTPHQGTNRPSSCQRDSDHGRDACAVAHERSRSRGVQPVYRAGGGLVIAGIGRPSEPSPLAGGGAPKGRWGQLRIRSD